MVGAGGHHQRPGLGEAHEGARHGDPVGLLRRAPADGEQGAVRPRIGVERGIGRHHQRRRQVLARQVIGHGAGHRVRAGDARHGREHRLGHGREERDPLVLRDIGARGHDVGCGRGELLVQRGARRLVERPAAERTADRAEDGVAPACLAHARRPLRQSAWKVAPSGAGRSRAAVHPPASGSCVKRPRRRPSMPSTRMPTPVARR